MSKTIQLWQHTWQIPEPNEDDEIFFSDLPKADQYWRRDESYPEIWYEYNPLTVINADKTNYNDEGFLISLNRDDTDLLFKLQTREIRRRKRGIWFYNNGEMVYLTGSHYFFLQWVKMPGYINERTGLEYGDYREFQRDVSYFVKMCWEDRNCYGFYLIKGKKTGITQFITGSEILERGTRMPGQRFGMMSVNKPECLRTNFHYFKYGFDNLPYILRPTLAKDNEDKFIFGNPRAKNTGSKSSAMKQLENGKGFNSEVFAAATIANAFDGPVMNVADIDEFPKLEDPYPKEAFLKSKETVKIGTKKNGLLMLHAYAPETDGRSHREGKEVWDDSDIETKNPYTNTTSSGLYQYFIPADTSGEESFDIYGKPDRAQTKKIILATRDQLKNKPKELQAYTRQYPLTIEEAWREGGASGTPFDTIRLGIRKEAINQRLKIGDLPYVEGNLEWMGDRLDSPVMFRQTTDEEKMRGRNGKFRIYGMEYLQPSKFNVPVKEKLRDYQNRYKPDPNTPNVLSVDPTDYVAKGDVKEPSNFAMTAMNHRDIAWDTYHGKRITNRMFLRYLHRLPNPNDMYEDLIKAVFWTGAYVIIESNKPWLITKMKEDKLHNFLLLMDRTKGIIPFTELGDGRIPTTQTNTINDLCREGNAYLAPPLREDDFDYLETVDDEVLCDQLIRIDPANTTKYDLAMCWLWNVTALRSFGMYRKKKEEKRGNYDEGLGYTILRKLSF